MSSPCQFAGSVSAAHRTLPSFTTQPLPAAPLLANTWQAAQGLLSARPASHRFPGTGCVFSFEGPRSSVTSLAGISGLRSFPPVQTHLADKRGFESLQTQWPIPDKEMMLRSSTWRLSEATGHGVRVGCPGEPLACCQAQHWEPRANTRASSDHQKITIFARVCVCVLGRAGRDKYIKTCQI